jgi:hypothetical protein
MAVVGIAALLSANETMRRRGQIYRVKADYHFAASHQLANEGNLFICGYGMTEEKLAAIHAQRRAEKLAVQDAVEYHARLHRKYLRASETPWLPVEPDPPPPHRSNPILVSADDY